MIGIPGLLNSASHRCNYFHAFRSIETCLTSLSLSFYRQGIESEVMRILS